MNVHPKSQLPLLALTGILATGCGGGSTSSVEGLYEGEHITSLTFGEADISEVIKSSPAGDRAILVASKSRRVTLLDLTGEGLEVISDAHLLADEESEAELTHIDFAPNEQWAAVTMTLPAYENGAQVTCEGALLIISTADDSFGSIIDTIAVGPMPDAVDISPDGALIVTANEVDFNDGKCEVEGVTPSVSIIDISSGPSEAQVLATIEMVSEEGENLREPEQIWFDEASDIVVATLQDTHEVLSFSASAVIESGEELIASDHELVSIHSLPLRSDGAEPWPDGIVGYVDGDGAQRFAVAGEYNDTIHILDELGAPIAQVEIDPAEMPGDLPRNLESWSLAPYRPDSLAAFNYAGESFITASLKHSGAVGVWQVSDLDNLILSDVIKVGENDEGTPETESTIGAEGITATPDGLILTANEGESSVSLVGPIE